MTDIIVLFQPTGSTKVFFFTTISTKSLSTTGATSQWRTILHMLQAFFKNVLNQAPNTTKWTLWMGVNTCILMSFRYLGNPWPMSPQLNVHSKAVDPIIEGGAQVQQILNIECVSDFTDAPVLNIQFRLLSESTLYFEIFSYLHTIHFWLCVRVCVNRYSGTLQNIAVKLPVMLNKFFQSTEMTSQDFFQRWKQLGA